MNTRLYNARIMTMDGGCSVTCGEIWVKDNRISYVGPAKSDEDIAAAGISFDINRDCMGNVLMPGFKDAHTHSAMVLFRSCADDEPLSGWLEKNIFPIEAEMTGWECDDLTSRAVLE